MQRYFWLLFISFFSVLLSSCASSPSPVLPPAKLTVIKPELSIDEQWYRQIGEGVSDRYYLLEPVFSDDKIYVIDYLGVLSAVNQENGDVLWEENLNLSISAGVTKIDDKLLVATNDGEVFALDISTGKKVWKSKVSSEVFAKPVQADNVFIIKTVDGKITALEINTGKIKWVYDRPIPALTLRGNSSPVVYENTVIAGMDNGKLIGLSAVTGQEIWSLTVAEPKGRTEIERMVDIDASPVINGENLYVVAYQGKIANIHITSGKLVWTRDFSAYNGMAFNKNNLFISDSDGFIWAIDKKSGATIWKQDKLIRRSLTQPAVHNNEIVVADFNGFVHWLDADDGHIKARVKMGGNGLDKESAEDFVFNKSSNILIAPIVYKDDVFVFDRHGHISKLTVRK